MSQTELDLLKKRRLKRVAFESFLAAIEHVVHSAQQHGNRRKKNVVQAYLPKVDHYRLHPYQCLTPKNLFFRERTYDSPIRVQNRRTTDFGWLTSWMHFYAIHTTVYTALHLGLVLALRMSCFPYASVLKL